MMHLRPVALGAYVAATLASCMSPEQIEAERRSICESPGIPISSEPFADCDWRCKQRRNAFKLCSRAGMRDGTKSMES